jgi:hypothetical protein
MRNSGDEKLVYRNIAKKDTGGGSGAFGASSGVSRRFSSSEIVVAVVVSQFVAFD